MRRGRLLPWRHSAYVGTSIPSLSRSTRGGHRGHGVAPRLLVAPKLGIFCSKPPPSRGSLRRGPPRPIVPCLPDLSRPVSYPARVACRSGPHSGGGLRGRLPDFPVFRKTSLPPPCFFLFVLPLSRRHSVRPTSVLITCWADASTR